MTRVWKPLRYLLSLLGLLVAGSVFGDWEGLDTEVVHGMELWQVPGLAVAVASSEGIEFQRGFGRTASKDGRPVDEHTMFAIASTTKAMVAAGLLMLVDEERIALDDLIIEHLPELHFADAGLERQLTIRDLLAHRTGLPSTDYWAFLQAMPLAEQIRRLRLVTAIEPPRTRLIYQNTMYELAGEIINRVTGQQWDRFLSERLWLPIGMRDTVATRGAIPDRFAHVLPHKLVGGKLVPADWDLYEDHADAAGSVWSSLHDMTLWAQFLLRDGVTSDGRRLVSEDSVASMFTPQQLAVPDDFYPTVALTKPHWLSYGLGWFQQDFQGRKIDFHTGSLSGLIALIGLDRAGDRAFVVLGNRDHAEVRHALLWYVMDNSDHDAERDWNQDVFELYAKRREGALAEERELEASRLRGTKPALPLKAYAGTYCHDAIGDVNVRFDSGSLTLTSPTLAWTMEHWHLETFQLLDQYGEPADRLSFDIGPSGTVTSLTALGETFIRKGVE